MGLDIHVGYLARINSTPGGAAGDWLRKQFRAVNEVLAAQGLPAHEEPEELPPLKFRGSGYDFPYPFLHYLRRYYAHVKHSPDTPPPPLPRDADASRDEVLRLEYDCTFDSPRAAHLLFQPDCEGFYVPVEFRTVILAPRRVPGDYYAGKEEGRRGALECGGLTPLSYLS